MPTKEAVEKLIFTTTLPKSKGPFGSILPIYIGHSICTEGHIYGPFRRKKFVFQYILSGEGIFNSPYGTFYPKEGDLIIMHRGDLVSYSCTSTEWECIWVEFECNEPLPDAFETGVIHSKELKEIFLEILKVNNLTLGKSAFICSCIWKIISVIDNGSSTQKNYSFTIHKAIQLIRRHYIQKISVSDIAASLNINRSYFCAIFKKEVGITPKEYIDNYRISAAQEILKQSNLTVAEIAESAGYNDTAAFSKAFKQKTGISPLSYKNQFRK